MLQCLGMVIPYPFRCILVPTDFSTCSDAALELAAKLAREQSAELVVLHVVELADLPATATIHPPEHREGTTVLAHTSELAERALTSRVRALPIDPARVRTFVRYGAPQKVIPAFVDEIAAELVVMGTHGRTGLSHLLVGSIAERLVRTSLVPVMTVRQPVCREQPLDPGLDAEKEG